ncbi:MAG: DUF4124 domain-containing protein [Pseudomonadota bacterium]
MMLLGAVMIGSLLARAVGVPLHAGEYYRWQDDRGAVVYTDRLPPDRVREGHAVLDPHGRELRRLSPEPTPEERAAILRERALRADQERAEREQAARDAMLLKLYSGEESILQARDARLAGLDAQREVIERQLVAQRERLAMLERQYPGHEEIAVLRRRIEEGERGIERLRQERLRMAESFALELERWRALKAASADDARARLSP